VSTLQFRGGTPIGTQLDAKILQPLVLSPARNGTLAKPVLVVIITDGAPGHEPPGTIARVVAAADEELKRTRCEYPELSTKG
jgi:Mg-chelatase subunit ChlD